MCCDEVQTGREASAEATRRATTDLQGEAGGGPARRPPKPQARDRRRPAVAMTDWRRIDE
jgi:hypothetical protein